MTSINALRLDFHSGLMLCDEARYWNPEWMIFYTPEKIRRITNGKIISDTVMFMGQTGTSSIGDEWIMEIERAVTELYRKMVDQNKVSRDNPLRLNKVVKTAFDTIIRIKQMHIDDFLVGKFGFKTSDLIRGYSLTKDNQKVSISNQEQVKSALDYMTFAKNPDEVKGIFGNSQVLAGYNPRDGFKMFYMTERWPVCEEVHEIFVAQGSGRDTCDLNYARFADRCRLVERRGDKPMPRQKGLFALLKGLHQALNQTAGIGGYPKIIYINGHEKDSSGWVTEISDCRSKLALEITGAAVDGLINQGDAEELIDAVIFKGDDFFEVNRQFVLAASDQKLLDMYLRRYSVR
jgi:hypothetical protein